MRKLYYLALGGCRRAVKRTSASLRAVTLTYTILTNDVGAKPRLVVAAGYSRPLELVMLTYHQLAQTQCTATATPRRRHPFAQRHWTDAAAMLRSSSVLREGAQASGKFVQPATGDRDILAGLHLRHAILHHNLPYSPWTSNNARPKGATGSE